MMLGSVNRRCISTTRKIKWKLLLDAVRDREWCFDKESFVSNQVSDIYNVIWLQELYNNLWLQKLNNIWQYSTSATEQQHLPCGTIMITFDFRNNNHLRHIWPISPTDIYVYVSFWNIILQCPLSISNTIINRLSNKHNSAATNVSRCRSRLNVVTGVPCSLSFLQDEIWFNFPVRFFPQFEWSAVRLSFPIAVLVTIYF